MSTGPFQDSKYADDLGNVYNCVIQPETLTLTLDSVANTATPAAVDMPVSAIMKSGRKIGCNARTVRVEVTAVGTGPYAVGAILTVPVLTITNFNDYERGETGSYNGADVKFVGKTSENRR